MSPRSALQILVCLGSLRATRISVFCIPHIAFHRKATSITRISHSGAPFGEKGFCLSHLKPSFTAALNHVEPHEAVTPHYNCMTSPAVYPPTDVCFCSLTHDRTWLVRVIRHNPRMCGFIPYE